MTKKIPPPNYVTRKPIYPAVQHLRLVLGEQNTYINLSEVALRLFEEIMKAGNQPETFVKAVCDHLLKVKSSLATDWSAVRTNGHRFDVVQVMTVADAFLKRLAREYRLYKGLPAEKWRTQVNGKQLDALDTLTENLDEGTKADVRAYPEYDLLQYYGDVRNRTIHCTTRDTDAELTKLLKKHEQHFQASYSTLPSKFEEIDYDDFLLLTRAVNNYANILNDACGLNAKDIAVLHTTLKSVNPKDEEAVKKEIIDIQEQDLPWLDKIRRMKAKPEKLVLAVDRLRSIYDFVPAEAEEIKQYFETFLQGDPTSRVRKKT